jgi:hypothetical protein
MSWLENYQAPQDPELDRLVAKHAESQQIVDDAVIARKAAMRTADYGARLDDERAARGRAAYDDQMVRQYLDRRDAAVPDYSLPAK